MLDYETYDELDFEDDYYEDDDDEDPYCFHCDEVGHDDWDCPYLDDEW